MGKAICESVMRAFAATRFIPCNGFAVSFVVPCLAPIRRYGEPHHDERAHDTQREDGRMAKDGLCAILTGSASGLGAATAAMLAKAKGPLSTGNQESKSSGRR